MLVEIIRKLVHVILQQRPQHPPQL